MSSHTVSPDRVVAVIFDWAGTTVDHGSLAPVEAIRQLFAGHGVDLTEPQIRRDMGLHKREHIRCILTDEEVQNRWQKASGCPSSDADVDRLFAQMLDIQLAVLARHSQVIPGLPETAQRLRAKDIRIGSTTGYTRAMMEPLTAAAATQGYAPDCLVCPEDVGGGRPFPWMIYRACTELRTYPLWQCVKVGDTVSDVEEGRNAGAWTVGLTRTGNLVGLSEHAWLALPEAQKAELLEKAAAPLRRAGADFVIDSAASIEPVLDQIEQRLRARQRPGQPAN